MPTSIRLPPDLLDRVDRAAHRRDMNRTEFISMILSKAVAHDEDWPHFVYDRVIESAQSAKKRGGE